MTAFAVNSEAGRLKTVMLHRPGLEMTRLTPQNKDELLFDEILWLEKAQKEHDAFAELLRGRGIEVLYLQDLLAEALANDEARQQVTDAAADERVLGKVGADLLRGLFGERSPEDIAGMLIGGLTVGEAAELFGPNASLTLKSLDPEAFVLAPLPNHLFTRDTSCWAYDGVAINAMMMQARQPETLNLNTVYNFHPRFQDADFNIWSQGLDRGRATVEGGDVHIIGNGAVLVGVSQRTTPQAVEYLARQMFKAGSAKQVIALEMPKSRAAMHLDTVMTMLDKDVFTKYQGLGMLPSFVLEPEGDDVKVTEHQPDEMHDVIAHGLGLDKIRVLTTPQTMTQAVREQWDDGCNLLAIAPGVAVAYERNTRSNDFLRGEGIEVLEIEGGELGRGRGGPRCMSCPIERDAIQY